MFSSSVELCSLSESDSIVELPFLGLSLQFSEESLRTRISAAASSFSESFPDSLLSDLFSSLDTSFAAKT